MPRRSPVKEDFSMLWSTLTNRTRFTSRLPIWLACFALFIGVRPLAADEQKPDETESAAPAAEVAFGEPKADTISEEVPVKTQAAKAVEEAPVSQSVMKKPPVESKEEIQTPISEPKPMAKAAPAEVVKKKSTPKIKLARRPRASLGPIVTAALPYRYRHKLPSGEAIVKSDPKPPAATANPAKDKPPTVAKQPPATIAKTPLKPIEIPTEPKPPIKEKPQPPSEQLAVQPKALLQPEPKEESVPATKLPVLQKIEVASFSGVQPGATTQEELVQKWGNPTQSKSVGDRQQLTFSIEPFDNVRVTLSEEKLVETIAITLAKSFPSKVVGKQLQLGEIVPTPVVDGSGKLLGQSFPERGVTFAFAADSDQAAVSRILLTQIRTSPFLARVSANLEHRHRENLRDLDYVIAEEPNNGRAWWLKSRVLLSSGKPFGALSSVKKAIKLQPDMPEYRLTRARIGAAVGSYEEAIDESKNVVLQASLTPEVKARGMTLLGDLLAAKPQPDFAQAIKYHMLAIKVADPLAVHKKVRVRRAAKDVLLDAHLGVATDIARGQWKNQPKVVPQWIARAELLAKDLVENEDSGEEVQLRILRSALEACAALDGRLDPSDWATEAEVVGQKLIAQSTDPIIRERLRWQLGTALLDGLKAEHARGQHERAIALGTQALTLLKPTTKNAYPIPERNYTVGQTYFRIGAIHAIHRKDHKQAVDWYGKAAPWLEKPLPLSLTNQLGPHGETFISMGVSFWTAGDKDKAVKLTEQGTHLLEKAVKDKLLSESALSVAYNNLSSMHKKLGNRPQSKKFEAMASRVDATKDAPRR
jgi:tetratricopeptide (TPR) repeat protein